jgi:hypothetical protein
MADEKIKLGIDYGDAAKATEMVESALDKLGAAAKATGNEGLAKLAEGAKSVVESFSKVAEATKETGEKTKIGLADIATAGQGLFGAFKEGNVSSAIDGIAGLAKMIPVLAPFGPAIDAAGLAVKTTVPFVKDLYEYIGKVADEMPRAAQAVSAYADALRTANIELKESDALKKARDADKAADDERPESTKDRSERFVAGIKGKEEEAIKDVTESVHAAGGGDRQAEIDKIEAEYQARLKAATDRGLQKFDDRYKRIERYAREDANKSLGEVGAKFAAAQKQAEELVASAKAGDSKAISRIRDITPPASNVHHAADRASEEMQHADREARRANEEAVREAEEQSTYERAHPEVAEERANRARAAQRAAEDAGVRSGGFEVLPELAPPRPAEAPRGLPAQLGLPELRSRPAPLADVGAGEMAQAIRGLTGAMNEVVTNQRALTAADLAAIQQLRRAADNAGAAIAANRSASSTGFQN